MKRNLYNFFLKYKNPNSSKFFLQFIVRNISNLNFIKKKSVKLADLCTDETELYKFIYKIFIWFTKTRYYMHNILNSLYSHKVINFRQLHVRASIFIQLVCRFKVIPLN